MPIVTGSPAGGPLGQLYPLCDGGSAQIDSATPYRSNWEAMMRRIASAFTTLLLLIPVTARAEWHEREAAIMGTRISVELWHEDAGQAEAAIDAVMAEMHRIDDLMSHYKPESQLSQINRDAATAPVKVDAELAALIARALEFSELSDGAFDITYASVGYLYDYREHRHPSEAQIRAALPAISWRHVVVDREASTVRFLMPGVRIDLGGIAKGYAVDSAARILQARGIRNATVSAGGDSRILGDRRGKPWIVGIRHPDDPNRVIARIPLEDTAMSTSGDYERYFDENGVRYHHIIDPHTGRSPVGVRSVTVIGPNATLTEGLTKSVFVMGPERGLALIETQQDVDAVIVRSDGRVFYSKGLAPPDGASTP
ncbi:MAG: ApbE family lipoprotein [Steroidobacteraceae bacterium]|nr:ApbE family lipoprotein [Steroidobacteraceae bacterium]